MPSNPESLRARLFPTAHRLILERKIAARLPTLTGDILVLGAGYDPYRQYLSGATKITTTDISDDYGRIDYVADAHSLPFADDTFDWVIAIEVFEHLSRPEQAARELLRVLKTKGQGLITTPFMFHVHGDPFDFTRFTSSGFRELFSEATSVEALEMGGRLHVISDIITTAAPALAVLRLINHLFRLPLLGDGKSADCPSGYWVEVTK